MSPTSITGQLTIEKSEHSSSITVLLQTFVYVQYVKHLI